jgi:hypothetical protein
METPPDGRGRGNYHNKAFEVETDLWGRPRFADDREMSDVWPVVDRDDDR